MNNFIFTYKPPNVNDFEYLDHLDESNTLIDIVLHNGNKVQQSSVIDFPYSDHKMILTECKFRSEKNMVKSIERRRFNEKIIDAIVDDIGKINFEFINDVKDVDNRYFFFKKLIIEVIEKHAPLKQVKCMKRKHPALPWYDNDLRRLSRECDKLYAKYKKSSLFEDKDEFIARRNVYQKLLRDKKINYFASKTSKDIKNSRKFWEFYQSSVKIKSDKSGNKSLDSLKVDGSIVTDKIDIMNAFSKHFSSFESEKEVNNRDCNKFILNTFQDINKQSKNSSRKEFSFTCIKKKEVIDLLQDLNERTSAGYLGPPVSILKAARFVIADPLVNIFNYSIKTKSFPNEFKTAIVSPLYKNKGDENDLNNYRGISVLPPLCKVFEKLLSKRIKEYFELNSLLFTGQHGFRANHSCETALHEVISNCLNNLDKKLINLLLFIDFKKAFDMVDPNLLIMKLLNYGFSNEAIELLKSYFNDRQQLIKLDNNYSNLSKILLGVPQGSVLGPLLFIIFINDLPYYLSQIETTLFADDTTLFFCEDNYEGVISQYKNGLKKLNEWCKHNRLYINWSKTYIMIITNKRINIPSYVEFDLVKVEIVDKFKLLGVLIDNKLHFNDYVNQQCISINKKLFAIRRLFYLSFEVKMQFFKTFILPYFDYCISLSIYYSTTAIRKLCKSYYLCLKILFNFRFTKYFSTFLQVPCSHEEVNSILKEHNLFSFHHRMIYRISMFIHKIMHGTNAPKKLNKWLKISTINNITYSLRSNNTKKIVLDRISTKFGDLTFKNTFGRYINRTKFISESNFKQFKSDLVTNIDQQLQLFLKLNKKFENDLNFYFFFV